MYKEEPYILTSSLGKVIVSTENFIFGKSVIQFNLADHTDLSAFILHLCTA